MTLSLSEKSLVVLSSQMIFDIVMSEMALSGLILNGKVFLHVLFLC